jgi:translocation and assembly module TamA
MRTQTALCCLAFAVAGCSIFRGEDRKDKSTSAEPRYQLDVEAPRELTDLLSENLDLGRFRSAPPNDTLSSDELDRLVAMAPEQAKGLLATEGYFNAQVRVAREPAAAGGQPRVVVRVEPGPRTRIERSTLAVEGELQRRAAAGDAEAQALLARLQDQWPLKPGAPFRQADWTSAKNATLGRLHADGYPTAIWIATDASVRSRESRADLEARARSGPLFRIGDLRIEGLRRYDERVVRNLKTFDKGTPYSEQRMIDFQERLTRSGLFEGAVAEIDTDVAKADAAPVTVRVQEQREQQATLGLGFSTDTGARATLEHTHRQPFGLRWTAKNRFEVGVQRKAWEFDYRSYPKSGFRRNLVAGELERWSGPDEERASLRLRAGRAWEDPRLERQAYLEYTNARVRTPLGEQRNAQALTANHDWTRRNVDSLLLPTRGTAIVLQTGAGYAVSSTADDGPLARVHGRWLHFRPFGNDWHATLRVEAGQVFARQSVGIPDTLLFRAGGDESVRGYEFRSLGPIENGTVTSGRSLFTASAEVARPLLQRLPQLWGAAFVDAGNAARRFSEIEPVVGVGVGLRYRSPVGPLRLDVAYGVEDQAVRLHLSAGVQF